MRERAWSDMKTIFLCEDSIEGIFTGIYKAYEQRVKHDECALLAGEIENYQLFTEYVQLQTDKECARKVSRTICRDLGRETYLCICQAAATEDKEKADAVYHTVVEGLRQINYKKQNCKGKTVPIMQQLTKSYVETVFRLSRTTNNEIMHMKDFLRFKELENGLLFAGISPKCNVLSFIAPHFADRLPLENFVIFDEVRRLFVVHPAKKEWFMATGVDFDKEIAGRFSEKEREYEKLFAHFCHTIAIKERENLKLQRQMLPLRFREYMVEF